MSANRNPSGMANPYRYTFDTVTAFLDSLNKPSHSRVNRSQDTERGHYGWFGTSSYKEAMTLACEGWQAGCGRISEMTATLSKRIALKVHKPVTVFDVCGDALEMGRFVSGEPEAFMTFEQNDEEIRGQKIIKIVTSLAVSGGISTEVIEARGAATAALVEALELAGFRCEVWIDVALDNRSEPGKGFVLNVCVKQASAPLQMDSLAFTLTHPSMFRRMIFRFMETNLPESTSQQMTGNGYGRITPMEMQGDINLDSMLLGNVNWTSPASVEAWLLDTLKAQGVHLNDE